MDGEREHVQRGTTEAWREQNRRDAEGAGYAVVENYPAGDREEGAALAQRLHDDGLIFAINRLVLHPLGLALGVQVANLDRERMRGDVQGLTLNATDDPEGFSYPQETVARNLVKLREAGLDALAEEVLLTEDV